MKEFEEIINKAWNNRQKIDFKSDQSIIDAIKKTIELVDKGKIRVGGMVKKDSISISSNKVNFIITDFKNEINVIYSGAVPNLFAEGKGVVAEGFLKIETFSLQQKF